jgi:hypothetical protein
MRFITSSAIALIVCVAGTSASFANEKDTSTACLAAESQVSSALTNPSQNADEARHEDRLGLQACNAGFYHMGMVHYAKAMELLGIRN